MNRNFEVPVYLADGHRSAIEVVLPQQRAPRGLIIVSPGSTGFSDPYLEGELQKPAYDPNSRGGLTVRLTEAGFGVAFFSQRGYTPLRTCVQGDTFLQRTHSVIEHCMNASIRASVTLSTITQDTGKVYLQLAEDPRTHGLNQISLAFSEGIFHISELVSKGYIHPIGIVGVGGPIESFSEVARLQLRREFHLNLAETAFRRCKRDVLDVSRILQCSGIQPLPVNTAAMRDVLGADSISREQLALRRDYWNQFEHEFSKKYSNMPVGTPTGGTFAGIPYPVGWSARYFSEILAETTTTGDFLNNFKGKTIYIFGSLDSKVPVPKRGNCRLGRNSSTAIKMCNVVVVDGVGHGLEDDTGLPTQWALDQIVRAVNSVNRDK